jgi:hypothetical protein
MPELRRQGSLLPNDKKINSFLRPTRAEVGQFLSHHDADITSPWGGRARSGRVGQKYSIAVDVAFCAGRVGAAILAAEGPFR